MAEQPPQKILELVRKLLALSTSSNQWEAAAAASKAQELLLKYNLEESQVSTSVDDTEITRQDYEFEFNDSWLGVLINGIAHNNLCYAVSSKVYKDGHREGNVFKPGKEIKVFHLFGKRPNIEVTAYMFTYIADEIDRITPKGRVGYKNSFRLGAVSMVIERMKEELRIFQSTEETRALVVTNKAALEVAVKTAFPKLTKGRSLSAGYGYADGRKAGKTIQFRQGVKTSNAAGQVLIGG